MDFSDGNSNLYSIGQIEVLPSKEMISIRSYCFCNPGINEINNCIIA